MAKRRQVEVEEVEVVEEEDEVAPTGGGMEFGLVIATTLALVLGIVLGLLELGRHYDAGPFGG